MSGAVEATPPGKGAIRGSVGTVDAHSLNQPPTLRNKRSMDREDILSSRLQF